METALEASFLDFSTSGAIFPKLSQNTPKEKQFLFLLTKVECNIFQIILC